jgi:hypothetical protein
VSRPLPEYLDWDRSCWQTWIVHQDQQTPSNAIPESDKDPRSSTSLIAGPSAVVRRNPPRKAHQTQAYSTSNQLHFLSENHQTPDLEPNGSSPGPTDMGTCDINIHMGVYGSPRTAPSRHSSPEMPSIEPESVPEKQCKQLKTGRELLRAPGRP